MTHKQVTNFWIAYGKGIAQSSPNLTTDMICESIRTAEAIIKRNTTSCLATDVTELLLMRLYDASLHYKSKARVTLLDMYIAKVMQFHTNWLELREVEL